MPRHVISTSFAFLLWILLPPALSQFGRILDGALGWPPLNQWISLLAVIPGITGILLSLWGTLQKQLLGLQVSEGSRNGRSGTGLHVTGAYTLTRHPVYWGFTLYLLGWMGILRTVAGILLLFPATLLLWILFSLMVEEPALRRRYGQRASGWISSTPFLPDPRRWRAAVSPPSIPPLYFIMRGVLRPLLRAWCGITHPPIATVPDEGPLIVAANHRSYLDAFLLAAAFPRPISFLASSEAFRSPWQRFFLKGLGCIRLRRYTPDAGAIRKVTRTLAAGGVVGIFPEGERSWDGGPSPTLPGVSRLLVLAQSPVIAVDLSGSYRLWPRWGLGPRRAPVTVKWGESIVPSRERAIELWLIDSLATHPTEPSQRNRSAADVGRLLWRCPSCRCANAVRGLRDGRVYCLQCGISGQLHDGSHLTFGGDDLHPLRSWARRVALSVKERRELAPPGPHPSRRWHFLRLSDGIGDAPLTGRGKGEAVLTPRALVLRSRGWRAYIPAETIRSVTVEGSHKLQVATSDRIYELRYRRGSPRGPRIYLEAWLDARGIVYRRS